MNIERENHGQSNIKDNVSPGPAGKSRPSGELKIIMRAAVILIIGTALLLISSFEGFGASGKYKSELSAVFYDPILPYPAAIIESLAKSETIRLEAAAAAAKVSSALVGIPGVRFEQGRSLLVVTAKARSEAGAAAAAKAVFDNVVAAYSAHPARRAAFSAYMSARDVGNIHIFGRALAEQALREIPVAVTILYSETKGILQGFAMLGLMLFTAVIGFMIFHFGTERRRVFLKLSEMVKSAA